MMYRHLLAASLLLLLAGCAGKVPISSIITVDEKLEIAGLLPPAENAGVVDKHIKAGIEFLVNHEHQKALEQFGAALRYDPQNSYVQFLNGLSYHLKAESGDTTQYEFAKIAYQLALKFNKNNWLASKQLARLNMKIKDYPMAQENFAHALLFQPNNPLLLYGLAQASYYAFDLSTAAGAIKRALELAPDHPDIIAASSMISAASGQPEQAREQLFRYMSMEANSTRRERVEERVGDWLQVHSGAVLQASDSSVSPEVIPPVADAPPPQAVEIQKESPGSRMVVIDVVMIRTEEGDSTSKGVNLLEGLSLQFSDTFVSFRNALSKNLVSLDKTDIRERITATRLSLADVKYNLNIFNLGEDRTEVLARPTLVANEGQKSTFFSGSQLAVAVSGKDTGSLERIDVGVKMEVTPTFVADDKLHLEVLVGRMFVEPGVVGSFQESVRVSKNEVSANVVLQYGQTLVLGGLREKQTSEIKSGVPILQDLPFVQYLFSHKKSEDYHKSIITLITPRRVLPEVYVSSADLGAVGTVKEDVGKRPYLAELKKSSSTLLSVDENIKHIMRHLNGHRAIREFREADLFDAVWYGSKGDLGSILKKTVTFLYY